MFLGALKIATTPYQNIPTHPLHPDPCKIAENSAFAPESGKNVETATRFWRIRYEKVRIRFFVIDPVLNTFPEDVLLHGENFGIVSLEAWPSYTRQQVMDKVDNLDKMYCQDFDRVFYSSFHKQEHLK